MRITYRNPKEYYGTKQSAEIKVNYKESNLGYHVIEALKVAGWDYEGKWMEADRMTYYFFKVDSKRDYEELKNRYTDLKDIMKRNWLEPVTLVARDGSLVTYRYNI